MPHGWASLATCPPPKSGEWRSLIFNPAAAAACRARAMPPAVANLRSCSWPLSADSARPTEPCYPLAVFALLLVPTDFRGDECAALEAESVPKQLARYLAWLHGLDTADDSSGVAPLHRALARESMAFMGRECELDEARRRFRDTTVHDVVPAHNAFGTTSPRALEAAGGMPAPPLPNPRCLLAGRLPRRRRTWPTS